MTSLLQGSILALLCALAFFLYVVQHQTPERLGGNLRRNVGAGGRIRLPPRRGKIPCAETPASRKVPSKTGARRIDGAEFDERGLEEMMSGKFDLKGNATQSLAATEWIYQDGVKWTRTETQEKNRLKFFRTREVKNLSVSLSDYNLSKVNSFNTCGHKLLKWGICKASNAEGGQNYYVTFRGSQKVWDWIVNVQYFARQGPGGNIAVHSGMYTALHNIGDDGEDIDIPGHILKTIEGLAKQFNFNPEIDRFIFVGHSLGGAYALLACLDILSQRRNFEKDYNVQVHTFGAPRVIRKPTKVNTPSGYNEAVKLWERLNKISYSFVNQFDPVPRASSPAWVKHVIPNLGRRQYDDDADLVRQAIARAVASGMPKLIDETLAGYGRLLFQFNSVGYTVHLHRLAHDGPLGVNIRDLNEKPTTRATEPGSSQKLRMYLSRAISPTETPVGNGTRCSDQVLNWNSPLIEKVDEAIQDHMPVSYFPLVESFTTWMHEGRPDPQRLRFTAEECFANCGADPVYFKERLVIPTEHLYAIGLSAEVPYIGQTEASIGQTEASINECLKPGMSNNPRIQTCRRMLNTNVTHSHWKLATNETFSDNIYIFENSYLKKFYVVFSGTKSLGMALKIPLTILGLNGRSVTRASMAIREKVEELSRKYDGNGIFAGHSMGGGLALATFLRLKKQGLNVDNMQVVTFNGAVHAYEIGGERDRRSIRWKTYNYRFAYDVVSKSDIVQPWGHQATLQFTPELDSAAFEAWIRNVNPLRKLLNLNAFRWVHVRKTVQGHAPKEKLSLILDSEKEFFARYSAAGKPLPTRVHDRLAPIRDCKGPIGTVLDQIEEFLLYLIDAVSKFIQNPSIKWRVKNGTTYYLGLAEKEAEKKETQKGLLYGKQRIYPLVLIRSAVRTLWNTLLVPTSKIILFATVLYGVSKGIIILCEGFLLPWLMDQPLLNYLLDLLVMLEHSFEAFLRNKH